MNELIVTNLGENNTIKSTELVEIINHFRQEEARITNSKYKELLHKNLKAKIEKEVEALNLLGLGGQQIFIKSTYINSQNKKQPCYELTKEGLKYIIDITKSRDRIAMQRIYEIIGGDYSKTICIDRFETTFFNKLYDVLTPINVKLVTQKQLLNGKYRLDGFLPKYDIVIEYDEQQHFVEPQKSKDVIRQKEIEEKFGYKFIRLNYKNTDAYNIGLVIKNIIDEI